MKNPPLQMLINELKQKMIQAINDTGLPASMVEPIICCVLADVRQQQNLELMNYLVDMEKQKEGEQKDGED